MLDPAGAGDPQSQREQVQWIRPLRAKLSAVIVKDRMRPKLHIVRDVAGAHDVYHFAMKLILSLLAMMALTSAAMASQEQIHNWKAATLVADTSLFGTVEVKATADSGGNVQTLTVTMNGTAITIPETWLKTLPGLPLASIQVRSERGYGPTPWLYIYFESPRIPKVQTHIAIQNGKLVRASITTVDAKGTAKHEDRKAP